MTAATGMPAENKQTHSEETSAHKKKESLALCDHPALPTNFCFNGSDMAQHVLWSGPTHAPEWVRSRGVAPAPVTPDKCGAYGGAAWRVHQKGKKELLGERKALQPRAAPSQPPKSPLGHSLKAAPGMPLPRVASASSSPHGPSLFPLPKPPKMRSRVSGEPHQWGAQSLKPLQRKRCGPSRAGRSAPPTAG